MNKTVLKVGAIVLFLGLASGCATTGLDDVKATANRAAADASVAAESAWSAVL